MKVFPFINTDWFELYANTYVIVDEQGNAAIVDPGKPDSRVISFLSDSGYKPKAILLTHGHFDHIQGIDNLVKTFNIPVFLNEKDGEFLKNPKLNCSDKFSRKDVIIKSEYTPIKDGDVLKLLSEDILVIETPYHTEGSSCFYLKDSKILFSGDSLFKGSIGRSDFPTSDATKIVGSLNKILSLPEETIVYPGHNEATTIKEERIVNHFVK